MPLCAGVQHLDEGNVNIVNLENALGKVDRKQHKHTHPVAHFKIKSIQMLCKLIQLNVYVRTNRKSSSTSDYLVY